MLVLVSCSLLHTLPQHCTDDFKTSKVHQKDNADAHVKVEELFNYLYGRSRNFTYLFSTYMYIVLLLFTKRCCCEQAKCTSSILKNK